MRTGEPSRLYLSNVGISQNRVRAYTQVPDMVRHVRGGGLFDKKTLEEHSERINAYGSNKARYDAKPIAVVVMDDGYRFIRDGHHRAVSIFIGGRKYLDNREFVFESMNYRQFADINFEATWVTPIDPRDYVRFADIGPWKQKVDSLRSLYGDEMASRYILTHQDEYAKKKKFDSIEHLAEVVRAEILEFNNDLTHRELMGVLRDDNS